MGGASPVLPADDRRCAAVHQRSRSLVRRCTRLRRFFRSTSVVAAHVADGEQKPAERAACLLTGRRYDGYHAGDRTGRRALGGTSPARHAWVLVTRHKAFGGSHVLQDGHDCASPASATRAKWRVSIQQGHALSRFRLGFRNAVLSAPRAGATLPRPGLLTTRSHDF
jgi:hypothetical protein